MLEPDGTARILVVDDREDKLLVYRAILHDLGQTIVTARSGEEALAHVLQTQFAVILLDVQMPGMDGLETAALIRKRKRTAHTPIIFLTAFDELRAAEGYATGAVDYMTTPVVPEVLRAKVRVFVDLYHMTQQVRMQAEERVALAEERTRREAAEGENRRLAFLAEASRVLAGSLDPAVIADAVARLPVPALADLAGLTVASADGGPWRTDLAWVCPPDPTVHARQLTAADGPRDPLREAVDRALATGQPEQLEALDVPFPADGEPTTDRIRSAAVFPLLARDRTLGALTLAFAGGRRLAPSDFVLARDLAARAAVALDNARLHHAVQRADRQKNEFLAMLAHELRNPLAPLRNAVGLLRHAAAPAPDVRWAGELIDRQVTHLARLVDDLLDVGRITQGVIRLQTEPLDLAALVAQAVDAARPLTDSRRHAVEVVPPDRPAVVVGDPTRLAQVVTNLLANAAKYTDEGGRIRVAVEADGGEVRVRVQDTGVGIPADMLAAVFELFTQVDQSLDRSQGGLGIGLTLVKRLVEMHGGSVAAESDGPGRGSTFTVRLPPAPPGLLPAAPRPAAADAPPAPLRVVVVDDNADAADSLAGLLELLGHRATVAYSGPAGLEAVRSARPDLAVLDIGLPGMDGYELARRLRGDQATRGVVLAAVSGYGREQDRERSRAAGFDYHYLKPMEVDALTTLLRTVSGRPTDPAG